MGSDINYTALYIQNESLKRCFRIFTNYGIKIILILKVEIMSDLALKLQYRTLTANRTDVNNKILLVLQQLEVIVFS